MFEIVMGVVVSLAIALACAFYCGRIVESWAWMKVGDVTKDEIVRGGRSYTVVHLDEYVRQTSELNKLRLADMKRSNEPDATKVPPDMTVEDLVEELRRRSTVGVVGLSYPDDATTAQTATWGWGYRPGQLGLGCLVKRMALKKFERR